MNLIGLHWFCDCLFPCTLKMEGEIEKRIYLCKIVHNSLGDFWDAVLLRHMWEPRVCNQYLERCESHQGAKFTRTLWEGWPELSELTVSLTESFHEWINEEKALSEILALAYHSQRVCETSVWSGLKKHSHFFHRTFSHFTFSRSAHIIGLRWWIHVTVTWDKEYNLSLFCCL